MNLDHDDGTMCKTPLDYVKGEPLAGLTKLKNYIAYGHELEDVKLQVCVKSIGAKKNGQSVLAKIEPRSSP